MDKLILYTRPDCHLCEEAEMLVEEACPGAGLEKVDIESDLDLISRYGLSIPVLARGQDNTELAWPFDAEAVASFINAR